MAQWVNVNGNWKSITNIWTNVQGSWKSVVSGWVNVQGVWKQFFSSAPVNPIVTAYPILSGTAQPFNTLTSNLGSYSNYDTGTAIQTFIMALIYDDTEPTQGTLPTSYTPKTTPSSSPTNYSVTQYDATTKSYKFYAVDKVKAIGSSTFYYYFSPAKISSIGTVTDNFDRTTSGMGTMSSGYTYSGPYTSPSWSTNGSYAISTATPTFYDNYNNWGLRSVEMSGRTNIDASIKFPGAEGGLGLAFWVTGSGSWWASTVEKYSSITTVSGCNGTQISTNSSGTGCGGCTPTYSNYTSYHCSGASNSYPNCSNGQSTCSTVEQFTCSGSGSGSSCPGISIYPIVGQRCGGSCTSSTNTTYGCTGVASGTVCPATSTSTYNASTVGQRCGACQYIGGSNYAWSTVAATSTTTYSWSTYQSYQACYPGTSLVESWTCNPYTSVDTTTYYTAINISSAAGSTVYTQSTLDVASSTSGYAAVYGMKVNTSGNTITAKLYSDYAFSTQLGGTLTYTPSNPTKADAYGASSVGIVRGATDASPGTQLNDFTVS